MKVNGYPISERTGELWKRIPGFSNYIASYLGEVARLDGTIIEQSTASRGYKTVLLRGTRHRVHRLIYKTFIGPLDNDLVILHLDDVPNHNHVGNLKQGTQGENVRMGFRLRKGTNWAPRKKNYDYLINQVLRAEYV